MMLLAIRLKIEIHQRYYEIRKDFRIGPPKISHFATLEWQKTMLEAKRRLNFDTEMQ